MIDRFLSRFVEDATGCWTWLGSLDRYGYGGFWVKEDGGWVKHKAHRVSYWLFVGPIPDGLQIDHLCRNRRCVNPAHLEPVTQQENARRSEQATRTSCSAGHPYTPANTAYRSRNGRPARVCRACDRLRHQVLRHQVQP